MRRDLPLIIIVIAAGVALALFAEPRPPESQPGGLDAQADAPDAVNDFTAALDPVFADCFGGVEPAGDTDSGAGSPEAIVDDVSEQVERIRELRFNEGVDARFLDPDEMRAEVEGLLEEELPVAEIRKEEDVLKELGAIPSDGDLEEIITSAFGSQVAGLYDTTSEELLVHSSDEVDAEELITLAHELDHALADQALGLRDGAGDPRRSDSALAYSSVVEGDATLTMELYALRHVGLGEQLELGESAPGAGEFEALPDYAQRNLLFPYLEGMRLACHRYVDGGWEAVNRLYDQPPKATSQVIFPDRYGVIDPVAVELPPRPGPGWTPVTSRQLGAAELEWLFHAPGGDPEAALPDPRLLVFGWAGGELELWRRGDERALGISLRELPETDSLCGAMAAWYRAGWPEASVEPGAGQTDITFTEPGRTAVLACPGNEVRMGLAPDRATASSLAM